ncbi:MAG: hypothetical protein ISS48_00280 [Candidatus Aenigmarchaeota archaeon]|nr:hypothetical protein [Candidatus Aenigmarchaeota archaeon]
MKKYIFGIAVMILLLAMPVNAQDVAVDIITSIPDTIISPQEFILDINVSNFDEFDPAWNVEVKIEDLIMERDVYVLINETDIDVLWSGESVIIGNIAWNVNYAGEHMLIVTAKIEGDTDPGNNVEFLTLNFAPNGVEIAAEMEYDEIPTINTVNSIPIRLRNFGTEAGNVDLSLTVHKSNISADDIYSETITVNPGDDTYVYAEWTPADRDIYKLELKAENPVDVIQENNFQNKTIMVTKIIDTDFFITDKNSNPVSDNIYVEIPGYLVNQYINRNKTIKLPDANNTILIDKWHPNGAIVSLNFSNSDVSRTMRLIFEDVAEADELEIIGFIPDWNYSGVGIEILDIDMYTENITRLLLYTCSNWNLGSDDCSNWDIVEPILDYPDLFFNAGKIQGFKLTENRTQESEPPATTETPGGTPGGTGTTSPPSGGAIIQTPNTTNTTNTTNVTTNITEPITNITTPVCAEGDRVCAGNSLQTCENNEWLIEACPNGCDTLTKRCKEVVVEPPETDNWLWIIPVIVVILVAIFIIKIKFT